MMITIKVKFVLKIILFILIIPLTAYGADGQIKIGQTASTTFPIQITQSGSYVLTSNLTVSTGVDCIQINVDNVTLDLNGHTINGQGLGGRGITNSTKNNITIMNGTVCNFAVMGIVQGGNANRVNDITCSGNGGNGIYAQKSIITNCEFIGNASDGINAVDCTITNCVANENSNSGIHATGSTITNCTVNYNLNNGIDGGKSTITNCVASFNTGIGIVVADSTITNCTANENNGIGISARYSTITNCTTNLNNSDGIKGRERCRIEGNNLRSNGGYGLLLEGYYNYAIRNVATNNTSGEFQDNGTSSHMPTTGDNANYGF